MKPIKFSSGSQEAENIKHDATEENDHYAQENFQSMLCSIDLAQSGDYKEGPTSKHLFEQKQSPLLEDEIFENYSQGNLQSLLSHAEVESDEMGEESSIDLKFEEEPFMAQDD
ncbi:MAG: hypothetical protein K0S74_384 [Chlamydiales bacterium]|jgi:hypothetical protein|nr:hypothetical protein [Chlamydiales bacterium]